MGPCEKTGCQIFGDKTGHYKCSDECNSFYCNLVTDDIFADSGVPTKTKKDSEKKKKSTSKKKEEVEDIFDDPLNAAAP